MSGESIIIRKFQIRSIIILFFVKFLQLQSCTGLYLSGGSSMSASTRSKATSSLRTDSDDIMVTLPFKQQRETLLC